MLRRLRSLCSTCEHCRPRRALALLYQPPAVTVKRDMERKGLLRAYICVFCGCACVWTRVSKPLVRRLITNRPAARAADFFLCVDKRGPNELHHVGC